MEKKDWKYINQEKFDACEDRYSLEELFEEASLKAWTELSKEAQQEVYDEEKEDPWMPIEDFPLFIKDGIGYSRYYGRGHLQRLYDEIQNAKDIYWDKTHPRKAK